MSIYREISLNDQSLFQKLFGRLPKENAFIEINNLLALKENQITTITPVEIQQIEEKYKTNIKKIDKVKILDLFKKYLTDCLREKSLNEHQIEILNHLKTILLLDDKEIQKDSGKSPFLKFSDDTELFAMILNSLLTM